MKLGVTGAYDGGTSAQRRWLDWLFDNLEIETVRHSGSVGIDTQAHSLALARNIHVYVYPPVRGRHTSSECLTAHDLSVIMPVQPPAQLYRQIVAESEGLVALPDSAGVSQSWTWYAIEFAERMNKPVTICMPDGSIDRRCMHGQRIVRHD